MRSIRFQFIWTTYFTFSCLTNLLASTPALGLAASSSDDFRGRIIRNVTEEYNLDRKLSEERIGQIFGHWGKRNLKYIKNYALRNGVSSLPPMTALSDGYQFNYQGRDIEMKIVNLKNLAFKVGSVQFTVDTKMTVEELLRFLENLPLSKKEEKQSSLFHRFFSLLFPEAQAQVFGQSTSANPYDPSYFYNSSSGFPQQPQKTSGIAAAGKWGAIIALALGAAIGLDQLFLKLSESSMEPESHAANGDCQDKLAKEKERYYQIKKDQRKGNTVQYSNQDLDNTYSNMSDWAGKLRASYDNRGNCDGTDGTFNWRRLTSTGWTCRNDLTDLKKCLADVSTVVNKSLSVTGSDYTLSTIKVSQPNKDFDPNDFAIRNKTADGAYRLAADGTMQKVDPALQLSSRTPASTSSDGTPVAP